MAWALYHPKVGYYAQKEHPASGKDYVTGDTLDPAFARCLARYLKKQGLPKEKVFVDVGSGNGLFLAYLAEVLPQWTFIAVDKMPGKFLPKRCFFYDDIQKLPPIQGVIFSYELFDALPCHLVQYQGGCFQELYVERTKKGYRWVTGPLSSKALKAFLESHPLNLQDRQLIEVPLQSYALYRSLCQKLQKGLIITFDYGLLQETLYNPHLFPGGTLMAYRNHQAHRDLLRNPTKQDLSFLVNFSMLKSIGEEEGLETLLWTTQASFLMDQKIVYDVKLAPWDRKPRILSLFWEGSMGQDIRVLLQKRR